jgi:hypothetical protein
MKSYIFSAFLTVVVVWALAGPVGATETGHHGAMAEATGESREAIIDFAPDPSPGAKLVTDFPAGLIYVVRSADGEEIFKHVNSRFRVKDPSGKIVLESESVHSHTGVFMITQSFASPGTYTL